MPATKTPARPAAKRKPHAMQRADSSKPVDGFFAKQPPTLRAILARLRQLVEEAAPRAEAAIVQRTARAAALRAAPRAEAAIKWGMPVYSVDGKMAVALGAHEAHVNLVLTGARDSFDDPEGRLGGTSNSWQAPEADQCRRDAERRRGQAVGQDRGRERDE